MKILKIVIKTLLFASAVGYMYFSFYILTSALESRTILENRAIIDKAIIEAEAMEDEESAFMDGSGITLFKVLFFIHSSVFLALLSMEMRKDFNQLLATKKKSPLTLTSYIFILGAVSVPFALLFEYIFVDIYHFTFF